MLERRSHVRYTDIDLVMLSWEENGMTLKQLGNVKDVSLNGMGVIVDNDLPIGTMLNISYGEGNLSGIVRHQRGQAERHFIGIELGVVSRGSALYLIQGCSSDSPFERLVSQE